jgi:hypothetical protein
MLMRFRSLLIALAVIAPLVTVPHPVGATTTVSTTEVPVFSTGTALPLAALPDGSVLVGGTFGFIDGVAVDRPVVRLLSNGSIDPGWSAQVPAGTYSSALVNDTDGTVILGGTRPDSGGALKFTLTGERVPWSIRPDAEPYTSSAVSRMIRVAPNRLVAIATLVPTGAFAGRAMLISIAEDTGLFRVIPLPDAHVPQQLALLPDGSLVVAVTISIEFEPVRTRILRLAANTYALEATIFDQATSNARFVVNDGWIHVAAAGVISRYDFGGTIDRDYRLTYNGGVGAMTVGSDQRLYLTGSFDTVAGRPRARIARTISAASTVVDEAWIPPDSRGSGSSLLFVGDQLLVGGGLINPQFNATGMLVLSTAGTSETVVPGRRFGVRINSQSVLDTVAGLPDGSIVAAGSFSHVTNAISNTLVRVTADGSVDSATMPLLAVSLAQASAVDGLTQDLYMAGSVATGTSSGTNARLVRIPRSGGSPEIVLTSASGTTMTVAANDTHLYVGGDFSTLNGQAQPNLARYTLGNPATLDPGWRLPQHEFSYVIGRMLPLPTGGVITARARSPGSIDFNPPPPPSPVTVLRRYAMDGAGVLAFVPFGPRFSSNASLVGSLALDAQQRIYATGPFRLFDHATHRGIARMAPDGTLDTAFAPVLGDWTPTEAAVLIDSRWLYVVATSPTAGGFHVLQVDTETGVFDPEWRFPLAGAVAPRLVEAGGRAVAVYLRRSWEVDRVVVRRLPIAPPPLFGDSFD